MQLILIAGIVTVSLGLPVSLILALAGKRAGYPALRICMFLTGTFLTFAVELGIAFNVSLMNAFSSLPVSEWSHVRQSQLLACLPLAVGLLAILGPHILLIRWLGRILVFAASPLAAAYGGFLGPQGDFLIGTGFYLVAAMFCWEVLVRAAGRMERQQPATETEEAIALEKGSA